MSYVEIESKTIVSKYEKKTVIALLILIFQKNYWTCEFKKNLLITFQKKEKSGGFLIIPAFTFSYVIK